jgi:hypothetical protein
MTSRIHQFQVGDRVQLIAPLIGVQVGSIGTVVAQFVASTLYNVQFDGQTVARVVDGSKLAPVAR